MAYTIDRRFDRVTDDLTPVERMRQTGVREPQQDFTREEEQEIQDAIDDWLRENKEFKHNIIDLYERVVGRGEIMATSILYQRCVELAGILQEKIDDEETVEKLSSEREKMLDLLHPNDLSDPIYESRKKRNPTYELRKIVRNHGTVMREYSFSLLAGSMVTSEGSQQTGFGGM